MTLMIASELLSASAEDRTLDYRLLPYGEPGRTSAGTVTAGPGVLPVPAEPLPVNLEHDAKRPLGTMTVTEDAGGLNARVSVLDTTAGRDAFTEATARLRAGISVEVSDPVIRDGRLLAGSLTGAGLVVNPAFPSATLTAADCGDVPNEEKEGTMPIPAAPAAPAAPATEAGAPAALTAEAFAEAFAGMVAAAAPAPAAGTSLRAVTEAIAASRMDAAALDVITKADVYDALAVPQYVGELRTGRRYKPRYIPLLSGQDLTSSKVSGWRYKAGKKPTVGDWTQAATGVVPNEVMADIPTSEVVTEPVSTDAAYLAGGNSIGRIHRDLPTPGFWESYLRESDDDFMRKLDAKVLGNITTPANQTAVVSAGADATNVWTKLILGAHNVLEYDLPEWALIGPDLWRQAMATSKLEALELLTAQLQLEEGSLANFRLIGAPVSAVALNGTVTVGTSAAATLHTLPGGPTRVEALNVQKGTIDNGVYGYWAIINHAATGIVKVS